MSLCFGVCDMQRTLALRWGGMGGVVEIRCYYASMGIFRNVLS